MIEPSALANSGLFGESPQFRIKCKLPAKKVSLHLMTSVNASGRAVVDWLTAKSNVRPYACQSFERLQDDTSYLSRHCNAWENQDGDGTTGKWGRTREQRIPLAINDRLIDHLMSIRHIVHWNLFNQILYANRFECDNFAGDRIGEGDTWQIFVR